MSFEAYNLRLRRKEQIQNPHFEVTQTSRGPRYFVKGTGSDGTKLSRLVSKSDYERMKGGMRSPMMSPVRSPVRNTGYVSPRVSTRRSPTRKSPARMSPRALGPRSTLPNVSSGRGMSPAQINRPSTSRQLSPLAPLSPMPQRSAMPPRSAMPQGQYSDLM